MRCISPSSMFVGCVLFLTVFPWRVSAKIPEPDTILVGSLHRSGGTTVTSVSGQTLVVRAVVDGATLATAEVPAGGDGRFVLRVPMDDGASPRLAGTAKSSDRIRVIVDNAAAELSAETEETKSGGVEIPAGRGNVLVLSFSVSGEIVVGDVNANGIPDVWESRYAMPRNGHAGLSLQSDDSALDNDGDGFSNREEWVAGTDPLDETSRFSIRSIETGPDALRIAFGPMTGGRLYTLRRSASLSGDRSLWDSLATMRSESDAESFTWILPVPTGDAGFYSIGVEVAE